MNQNPLFDVAVTYATDTLAQSDCDIDNLMADLRFKFRLSFLERVAVLTLAMKPRND